MKYEQYFSLIKRLEESAKLNPTPYRLKVKLLAALGYAYILAIIAIPLICILVLAVLMGTKLSLLLLLIKSLGKLVIVLAVLIGGILTAFFGAIRALFGAIRALFKGAMVPQGIRIDREVFPQLFETIEEICNSIDSPSPDEVVINSDFQASIMTVPRFGFFGSRTYLNLGLPLLQSVSPEHFKAILAHEMGHISKRHGSDSAWIYQLRETWARFLEQQEESGSSSFDLLYTSFVNWYFPYFNAYSFVLARKQERDADQMAAKLYGGKLLAESLIITQIKGDFLENEYWKDVFDKSKTDKNPPKSVFGEMQQAFLEKRDKGLEMLVLSKALKVRSSYEDTHPSLAERLDLLGYLPKNEGLMMKLSAKVKANAANKYFGEYVGRWTKEFDKEWENEVFPYWTESFKQWGETRRRIDELNEKYSQNNMTDDEKYELAELLDTYEGEDFATPLLKEIVETNPQHAMAKFALGSILLGENDESGVKILKESMVLDQMITIPACEALYTYFYSNHREKEALLFLRKADSFNEVLQSAELERQEISDTDDFEFHSIEESVVKEIIKKVSFHEEIEAAYLVRKKVAYIPEIPLNVLGIKTKKNWIGRSIGVSDENLLGAVLGQVEEFDIHYVVILGKQFKNARKKIEEIGGVLIYEG